MQRFYIENFTFLKEVYISDKDLLNQMTKVLRFRTGDEFIIFDGNENIDFKYVVSNIDKKNIIAKFIQKVEKNTQKGNLDLYVGTPNKLEKIEFILQKGTEIGVDKFCFFYSERSQKLNISENKMKRLHNIITEAVEQSNRNSVPKLFFEDSLPKVGNAVFFHTKSNNSKGIFDIDFSGNTSLIIGPEGGFTDFEISAFENNDFVRAHLGDNILRCETCAVSVAFFAKQSQIKDHL